MEKKEQDGWLKARAEKIETALEQLKVKQ
jgi:phage I-like protein